MTQEGDHTWDLFIHYFLCPRCQFINESRIPYEYRLGKFQEDIECGRCHKIFTVTKVQKPRFGPLIGRPQPTEIEWRL